jgi:peptide-methionine (R)-S-oxide reductase
MQISKREFLTLGSVAAASLVFGCGQDASAKARFPITFSDVEWRKKLSGPAYRVLRHQETERAFSSSLNNEKRRGSYHCAGCEQRLFASTSKFESGTGWPSFFQPLPDAIGTKTDYDIGYARTEVHCRRCGGHLGHVFDDGPRPTGKRYCMNGVAMTFKPG